MMFHKNKLLNKDQIKKCVIKEKKKYIYGLQGLIKPQHQ